MKPAVIHMIQSKAARPCHQPSTTQSALIKCLKAYQTTLARSKAAGKTAYQAECDAIMAYKINMPSLDNIDQVKSYISCLVQGVTFSIFESRETGQLLYAAQVALSIEKSEKK